MEHPKVSVVSGRFLWPALVLAAALGAVYFFTFNWMYLRWTDEADQYFSHGPFVPIVALLLVLIKSGKLRRAPLGSSRAGLYLVLASIFLHLFATLWGTNFLSGVSLVAMLLGLELYLLGPAVTRVLLLPTLFLLFMVPLPQVTISWAALELKILAARVAVNFFTFLGYDVIRVGSDLHFDGGQSIRVDEVCSGLKYLFSLIAFGGFYVQLTSLTNSRKFVLFLLAFPLAWLANVVRILTLCIVANHFGSEKAQQWYSHDLFGFVMYFLAFILMFLAESGLRIGMKPVAEEQSNA